MVKRGPTKFSATKVAKAGLAASAALEKILSLEKEVSRLRHHVSVLSKRNHRLQIEAEKLMGEGKEGVIEAVVDEVASSVTSQEPEPQVVAEPSDVAEKLAVAAEKAGVRIVAPEAEAEVEVVVPVAEPRVAMVVDEDCASVVSMPEGKRRRVVESSEEGSVGGDGVEEVGTPVVPLGPRNGAPLGPASMVGGVRRGGVNIGYGRIRFVDRALVGQRSGMVGDSYYTRGESARAQARGRGGWRGYGAYR